MGKPPYIDIELKEIIRRGWCWVLNGNDLKVLCAIGDYFSNREKKAFPSIDMLEIRTGLGRKAIIKSIEKIKKLEFIFKEKGKGCKNNTTYRFRGIPTFLEHLSKKQIEERYGSLQEYKKLCRTKAIEMMKEKDVNIDRRIDNVKNIKRMKDIKV